MLVTTLAFRAAIALSAAAHASSNIDNLRRDETPQLPYDPNTTQYCSWWWDNDGSVPCADIPAAWGITLADFQRWVS